MSVVTELSVPIIAAPMAGGPSTPDLARAVSQAGGLGFLGTGTMSAEEAAAQMASCAGTRVGVNLFAPQEPLASVDEVWDFVREAGVDVDKLPDIDYSFGWDAKLAAVIEARPAVASTMFGPFSRAEVDRLHDAGIEAWVTVTTPDDAATAERLGVDAVIVQGPEAGGHRGTWDVAVEPDWRPLTELLDAVNVGVPVIAAGGVTEKNIGRILEKADAVSCGSAFLMAEEAGTSEHNRELLRKGGESVSTRAFSGRYARGLATEFTRTHDVAPIYPWVNPLLKPRRSEPDFAYCLAGLEWPRETEPAADIVRRLNAAR